MPRARYAPTATSSHTTAIRVLKRRDPALGALIQRIGPYRPRYTPNLLAALVGAVVHQQLSMRAAAGILRRLRARCPHHRFTAPALLRLTRTDLRAVGLSQRKAQYLHDIARRVADRSLSRRTLARLDDEAAIAHLTTIKGVGRWTAEMLLLFCLQRPDIWPIDDLGLRKAAAQFLNQTAPPPADELSLLGERWRPYRSYATWYLWRSLDGAPPSTIT